MRGGGHRPPHGAKGLLALPEVELAAGARQCRAHHSFSRTSRS
jgi:hypothetical protein